jgi:Stage II sporulation protein E (SpoIIE)
VGLAIAVLASEITAQSPATSNRADQIITAPDLASTVNVDGPWRLHVGDDPRFAEPGYDDSDWSRVFLGKTSRYGNSPNVKADMRWARVHLRLDEAGERASMALWLQNATPCQIFVNGVKVAETGGFAKRDLRMNQRLVIPLPLERYVTVAIRFYSIREELPVMEANAGEARAIQNAADLVRIREFDQYHLQYCVCVFICYGFVPVALILFFAQRNHPEYLWLGIFCLLWASYVLMDQSADMGHMAINPPVSLWVRMYCGYGNMFACLEFVRSFARRQPFLALRAVQALILLTPFLWHAGELYWFLLVADWALSFLFASALLWRSSRRGHTDCGLLMGPLLLYMAVTFCGYLSGFFPRLNLAAHQFLLGPVGVQWEALAILVCFIGIAGVVLYRFLVIAREEQRTGAEFEAARQVQRVLVPAETPAIPGFAIEAIYRPAGEVGGDFYQIVPTRDGGVLAVIGDVSGKGMPAAMTVSLLVGTFRTLAQYTQRPCEILAALNQRMIGCNSGGFTTCLVVRLDKNGTFTAANAGHLEPYVESDELKTENGLPLGLISEVNYAEREFKLQPGQQLTLLTDGVIEARSKAGELFGFERAAAITSQSADSIVHAAQQFGQEDDITVLTIKHLPVIQEARIELTASDLSPTLACNFGVSS